MSVTNVSNVDWNLFLVLHTVLEEGSATRAAKRLSVTQSAVSNALARLRVVFDDPLVVRIGNQLVPTAKARELAPHLRAAVGEISLALSPARAFDAATSTRRFVLATTDDVELWLVGPLLAELARALPACALDVVSLDAAAVSGLGTGEVDAIVGVVDPVPPGSVAEELCEDEVVLLVGGEHPLSRARAIEPRSAVHPRIAVGSRPDAAPALEGRGLASSPKRKVTTHAAAAVALEGGDAMLAVSRRAAKVLLRAFSLREVRLEPAGAPLSISLAWHAKSDADAGASIFREAVRAAVGPRAPSPSAAPSRARAKGARR